jgi:hypothetical protein
VAEYDHCENEMIARFPKRVSCLDHDLALILRAEFDSVGVFTIVLKAARKLVAKFKKSAQAQELLREKTNGKNVLLPAKTRWGTHYLMTNRLVELFKAVNEVAAGRGWTTLNDKQLKLLKTIETVLASFYQLLIEFQAEKVVTISKVYFKLQELAIKLEDAKVNCIN